MHNTPANRLWHDTGIAGCLGESPELASALRKGYRSHCDSLDGLVQTTGCKSTRYGKVMAFVLAAHPHI